MGCASRKYRKTEQMQTEPVAHCPCANKSFAMIFQQMQTPHQRYTRPKSFSALPTDRSGRNRSFQIELNPIVRRRIENSKRKVKN